MCSTHFFPDIYLYVPSCVLVLEVRLRLLQLAINQHIQFSYYLPWLTDLPALCKV